MVYSSVCDDTRMRASESSNSTVAPFAVYSHKAAVLIDKKKHFTNRQTPFPHSNMNSLMQYLFMTFECLENICKSVLNKTFLLLGCLSSKKCPIEAELERERFLGNVSSLILLTMIGINSSLVFLLWHEERNEIQVL